MKKFFYACSAFALTLMTGCQEADEMTNNTNGAEDSVVESVEMTAVVGNGETRTSLSENKVIWEMTDQVAVFYGYTLPSLFKVKTINQDSPTFATLSCQGLSKKGDKIDHRIGLYPYDANATATYDEASGNYTVATTFPTMQQYQENSFGQNASPMMAITTDDDLAFKNVGGSVKIMLWGNTKVSKIEVYTTEQAKISGAATYTMKPGETPTVILANEAESMITLDCGEGVQLGATEAEATSFILAIPPQTFAENELKFKVYDGAGISTEITKETAVEFKRSTITAVGPYEITSGYSYAVGGRTFKEEEKAAFVEAINEWSFTESEVKATLNSNLDLNNLNSATQEAPATRAGTTEGLTIPQGKTLTIDLNGFTISQEKECTGDYSMITNKGTLIIKDSSAGGNGMICFKDTGAGDPNAGWGTYTLRNDGGTLVVESGTITNLSEQNVKGEAFKHTTQAIFHYSGTTTINGGTISNPNYRSIRLWKGEVTINDGTFIGQVWYHCVDNTGKMTIKGGSFKPAMNDGSSVFINNSGREADFTVTGGFFNTKIGADSPTTLLGNKIIGGIFTENAKNNTNTGLLGAGYGFVENGDGNYRVERTE